jgi:membrane associated rhomboid family serine protease
MMFPIRTDSPVRLHPWMNWAVVALNVAVFIADWRFFDGRLMPRFQLDSRTPALHHFITYSFVHLSALHLACNMLVLLILGGNINDRLGHIGYLAFYLAAAVCSGVGFLAVSDRAVVGASGAVGAVMSAYLVLLPRSRITINAHFFIAEVSAMRVVIVFFAYNVLMSLASALTGRSEAVAYQAHIAGMIFGFLLVLALQGATLLPRQPPDLLSILSHWNRRRIYRALVARRGFDPFGGPQRLDEPEQPQRAPQATAPASRPRMPEPDPLPLHAAMLRAQVSEAVAQRNLAEAAQLFLQLKRIDPNQFLPRQAQYDIATQLASQQQFREAADAYEQFLRHYSSFEQIEQVQLILGLIYARYLNRYARAKECLGDALRRLHKSEEIELARTELDRIEPLLAVPRRV